MDKKHLIHRKDETASMGRLTVAECLHLGRLQQLLGGFGIDDEVVG